MSDGRAQRHAAAAARLHKVSEVMVRPLCCPAFVATASWALLTGAEAAGWHRVGDARALLPYRIAIVSTILAPLCLAAATVLTAVSTVHRGFQGLRGLWIVIGTAAVCSGLALVALARHAQPS